MSGLVHYTAHGSPGGEVGGNWNLEARILSRNPSGEAFLEVRAIGGSVTAIGRLGGGEPFHDPVPKLWSRCGDRVYPGGTYHEHGEAEESS